ncbi:ATP-binding protein [Pseudahrensia aquimaris]|uniref:histidine kinase n=1 Tax=Pseudahrensia aquimaris TaxID=744461 RepID=A0ABW3FHF9_9HYPH
MTIIRPLRRQWRWLSRVLADRMPTGLFGRSLIIIVAPMILLQAVMTFVFMERHWQSVTDRLSTAVVRDIAALVDVIETYPQDTELETVRRIASERLALQMTILPNEDLPPPAPKPFFSILDTALSEQITRQLKRPFWIDTVGNSGLLEIRIKLGDDVIRFFVRRSQASASNTHIFLLWMVGAAFVLLTIAVLFLRNQIRPIQRLADAADRFGRGQPVPEDFRPRGAAEVRRATVSFLEMRERVERSIEQRTAMLAGVSHDLRTVLTRFRLQLALVPQSRETEALTEDVNDMQNMLQGYLDFARGDTGEEAMDVSLTEMLARFEGEAETSGKTWSSDFSGDPTIHVRPTAFSRVLSNVVSNAFRYADTVKVHGFRNKKWLFLHFDDNGPGIAEGSREAVFRPFVRLDEARNLDESGTGLGLSIARDIVHRHGGQIELDDSPLGGLRVTLRLPA